MTEKSYSINAPQTDFPMKANSAVREVEIQAAWEANKIYERSLEKRKGADKKFVLHDGPPYPSSPKIHIGTALNKILKDIITKYKSLRGFYSPYVPGYDCHGLPIEHAVLKEVKGGHHSLGPVEVRKRSRAFALSNLQGKRRVLNVLVSGGTGSTITRLCTKSLKGHKSGYSVKWPRPDISTKD